MGLFSKKDDPCNACGHDGTKADPIKTVRFGSSGETRRARIHESHTTDPKSGFSGHGRRGKRS